MRAFRHVADRQREQMPGYFGVVERGQRIRGFARLRNRYHQGLGIGNAGAITVFAGHFNIAGNARDFFQPVARDLPGMVAGTAGKDEDIFDLREDSVRFRAENAGHQRVAVAHRFQRICQRLRLFVDFLLHVVLVFTQLHAIVVEFADMYLALHGVALGIKNAIVGQVQLDHIAFFQIHHVLGDLQQRRHIGSNEVLTLAHAQQ